MIGENKLMLNHATVVQAIQEWLDRRWNVDSPVVQSVALDYTNVLDGQPNMTVKVVSNKALLGVKEA